MYILELNILIEINRFQLLDYHIHKQDIDLHLFGSSFRSNEFLKRCM